MGIKGFMAGAFSHVRALRLIRQEPRLGGLIVVPFLVTLVLYVSLIIAGYYFYGDLKALLLDSSQDSWWATTARWGLNVVYLVLSLLIFSFTFIALGSLVCAPFNEALSRRVELAVLGCLPEDSGGPWGFFRDVCFAVLQEAKRLAIFVLLMLGCLMLLLVPVVQPP